MEPLIQIYNLINIKFGGFILELFSAILEVIALVFAATQILLLSRQIKDAIKWNKLNSTFIEIDKLSKCLEEVNPELIEKIGLIKSDDTPVDVEVFKELLKDPKSSKELYEIMHFYETFSIAVLSGYINSNIAKRVFYINVKKSYKKLKPYILLRSQMAGRDMCQHFQKLNDKWESEGLNLPPNNYSEVKKRGNK